MMVSVHVVLSHTVFDLMPTRWTCTSVCSISMTDHDIDGKCLSSVVVFDLMPTIGGLVPVRIGSVQLIMISVQADY